MNGWKVGEHLVGPVTEVPDPHTLPDVSDTANHEAMWAMIMELKKQLEGHTHA
jgi:hypothetical protein